MQISEIVVQGVVRVSDKSSARQPAGPLGLCALCQDASCPSLQMSDWSRLFLGEEQKG